MVKNIPSFHNSGSLYLYLFLCLCFTSCSRQSQDTTKQEEQSHKRSYASIPPTALDPDKVIPVGMCRIVATVVAIDSLLISKDRNDPCSKSPCVAMVRVDSLLGSGSGVLRAPSVGSTVRVRFTYTLASSKDLFPAMNPPLSGLTLGSQFKALVQTVAETNAYSIDSYEAK